MNTNPNKGFLACLIPACAVALGVSLPTLGRAADAVADAAPALDRGYFAELGAGYRHGFGSRHDEGLLGTATLGQRVGDTLSLGIIGLYELDRAYGQAAQGTGMGTDAHPRFAGAGVKARWFAFDSHPSVFLDSDLYYGRATDSSAYGDVSRERAGFRRVGGDLGVGKRWWRGEHGEEFSSVVSLGVQGK